MNRMFYGRVDIFTLVSMDDLLMFCKGENFRLEHLRTDLSRFKDNKLYVSRTNFEFMKSEITFLGMIVRKGGTEVDPKKDKVLRD